jgi:hypothetical protein
VKGYQVGLRGKNLNPFSVFFGLFWSFLVFFGLFWSFLVFFGLFWSFSVFLLEIYIKSPEWGDAKPE